MKYIYYIAPLLLARSLLSCSILKTYTYLPPSARNQATCCDGIRILVNGFRFISSSSKWVGKKLFNQQWNKLPIKQIRWNLFIQRARVSLIKTQFTTHLEFTGTVFNKRCKPPNLFIRCLLLGRTSCDGRFHCCYNGKSLHNWWQVVEHTLYSVESFVTRCIFCFTLVKKTALWCILWSPYHLIFFLIISYHCDVFKFRASARRYNFTLVTNNERIRSKRSTAAKFREIRAPFCVSPIISLNFLNVCYESKLICFQHFDNRGNALWGKIALRLCKLFRKQ